MSAAEITLTRAAAAGPGRRGGQVESTCNVRGIRRASAVGEPLFPIVRSKGKLRQARRQVRPGDAEGVPGERTSDKGISRKALLGLRRRSAIASTLLLVWSGHRLLVPTAPVAAHFAPVIESAITLAGPA